VLALKLAVSDSYVNSATGMLRIRMKSFAASATSFMEFPAYSQEDVKRWLVRQDQAPSPWHQMNWYVGLAGMDLAKLRPGDLVNLQDEFVFRMQLFGVSNICDPMPPTYSEIEGVQAAIRPHLERLADRKDTTIGPLILHRVVEHRWLPKNAMKPEQRARETEPDFQTRIATYHLPQENYSEHVGTFLENMADLLKSHGQFLRRCPKCRLIFLQFRRTAWYCSRKCQAVSAVQKRRAKQKDESSRQDRNKVPTRRMTKKQHGI
jgi:hypothetical protein